MALWYDENYDGQVRYGVRVSRTLFDGQSDFQRVEVVDTPAYGRVLIIDGIFMTSERDEYLYHEMISHPALVTAPSVKRVLIIGGGDGGPAREVLRHDGVAEVVMVEIDEVVVAACKEHMPALGAWADPRLEVRIGDGIAYVKEAEVEPFDVVLLDGTDPVGPGKGLFNSDFFRGVKRVLAPGGVFAMQSESPFQMREVFLEIQHTLSDIFAVVAPYFGSVPLYSAGPWSWTYASDSADPTAINSARVTAVEDGCQYYNRDIHRAAFVLPSGLRRVLGRTVGRG
ncbi:MAG: polyamine aminopropyltransferase [Myxococcota bacterium]